MLLKEHYQTLQVALRAYENKIQTQHKDFSNYLETGDKETFIYQASLKAIKDTEAILNLIKETKKEIKDTLLNITLEEKRQELIENQLDTIDTVYDS